MLRKERCRQRVGLLQGQGFSVVCWALTRAELPAFVIGGGILAMVGIAVGLSGASLGMGQAILYGVMGVLSLISGIIVLFVFIHQPDRTDSKA